MEKYVLDITIKIRTWKKGMTTTEVQDAMGSFVVKLRGLNIPNKCLIHNYLSMKMKIVVVES